MMSSRARKDVIPPAPLEYEMVMQYRRKTKLASSFTSRPVMQAVVKALRRSVSVVIGSCVSEETA